MNFYNITKWYHRLFKSRTPNNFTLPQIPPVGFEPTIWLTPLGLHPAGLKPAAVVQTWLQWYNAEAGIRTRAAYSSFLCSRQAQYQAMGTSARSANAGNGIRTHGPPIGHPVSNRAQSTALSSRHVVPPATARTGFEPAEHNGPTCFRGRRLTRLG